MDHDDQSGRYQSSKPPSPKHTPVPTSVVSQLTKSVTEVGKDVRTIKEDLLPPVARSAQEARDTVIELKGWRKDIHRRIQSIEETEVLCPVRATQQEKLRTHDDALKDHGGRIDELDREAGTQGAKHTSLAKVFWWVMGIVGVVAAAAVSFAFSARESAVSQGERIQTNTENIKTNRAAIKAITDNHTKVIEAVKAVGDKVSHTPTIGPLPEGVIITDDDVEKLPPYRQQQLKRLLLEMGAE